MLVLILTTNSFIFLFFLSFPPSPREFVMAPQNAEVGGVTTTASGLPKAQKSRELFALTIKSPPYSYACLEMVLDNLEPAQLDALQVRSYCSAALRQFLGDTGVAIAIDIVKVQGAECWLRVPRQDLAAFGAAITAFPGVSQGGQVSILRLRACGNWLGALLGQHGQQKLWNP